MDVLEHQPLGWNRVSSLDVSQTNLIVILVSFLCVWGFDVILLLIKPEYGFVFLKDRIITAIFFKHIVMVHKK